LPSLVLRFFRPASPPQLASNLPRSKGPLPALLFKTRQSAIRQTSSPVKGTRTTTQIPTRISAEPSSSQLHLVLRGLAGQSSIFVTRCYPMGLKHSNKPGPIETGKAPSHLVASFSANPCSKLRIDHTPLEPQKAHINSVDTSATHSSSWRTSQHPHGRGPCCSRPGTPGKHLGHITRKFRSQRSSLVSWAPCSRFCTSVVSGEREFQNYTWTTSGGCVTCGRVNISI